jgi:23S rRNA (adenine2503-C2)-methyltransferase
MSDPENQSEITNSDPRSSKTIFKILDPLGLKLTEWEQVFSRLGEPKYRALQAFQAVHCTGIKSWNEATTFSKSLRESLEAEFPLNQTALKDSQKSSDGTRKLLIEVNGGGIVESVVIASKYGFSLCLSTQIGCPVGCVFCRTGRMGYDRNLTAGEIVSQFYIAEQFVKKPVDNVILMGMGEPMLNINSVLTALEVITHPTGRNLSPKRITISTVGYPKKIKDLATKKVKYNLALSLHFTDDEKRRLFIPSAAKQPLAEIFDALDDFSISTGAEITLEYVLMDGVNCTNHDARALAYLAQWGYKDEINNPDYLIDFFGQGTQKKPQISREAFKVNLLPYNPIELDPKDIKKTGIKKLSPPSEERTEEFCGLLLKFGVRATVRRSRGSDINAACGMLGGKSSPV